MVGILNTLKLYSSLTQADPESLRDPKAEADKIFSDNNKPKTEQTFTDSTKIKSNYKSISSQDLEMLIWMSNPKKFEKEILNYLDQNLYFGSGADLVLNKTKNMDGELYKLNGDWYVPAFQVGSGHGLFTKENTRDISTTFTSIANDANYSVEQTRTWIKNILGLEDKELVTHVDAARNMIDNVYVGEEPRVDVMTQKFNEPQVVYKYNPVTGDLTSEGVKEKSENHLFFPRGASRPVPLDLAMKTTGFDFWSKLIQYKELSGKDDEIKLLNNEWLELQGKYGNNVKEFNKLKKEYRTLSDMLLDEQQSHERTKRGYSAGPLIEASYNGEKGNESVDVSYGLFTNIPFWDTGNKITLEFKYTPRKNNTNDLEPQIKEDRESHPVRPITGVSKSTLNTSINKEAYDITGGVGYEVLDDFTLMLFGGMRKEFENTSNSTLYETWFENNGVKYDYNSNILQNNSNEQKKHGKLGVGGKFHLGAVNLTAGVNYITNGTYEANAGMQFDFSTFFK